MRVQNYFQSRCGLTVEANFFNISYNLSFKLKLLKHSDQSGSGRRARASRYLNIKKEIPNKIVKG